MVYIYILNLHNNYVTGRNGKCSLALTTINSLQGLFCKQVQLNYINKRFSAIEKKFIWLLLVLLFLFLFLLLFFWSCDNLVQFCFAFVFCDKIQRQSAVP